MTEILLAIAVMIVGIWLLLKSFAMFIYGKAFFRSDFMQALAFALFVVGSVLTYAGWHGLHVVRILVVHHGF